MPISGVKFAHTNLIARDWRRLAEFYVQVFGCIPVPPERNYRHDQIERATGVPGAALAGLHLRLPGGGDSGPTLEIFSYSEMDDPGRPVANRLGYGHIAFQVADVAEARAQVLGAGGAAIGEVLTVATSTGALVTWCYVTDQWDSCRQREETHSPGRRGAAVHVAAHSAPERTRWRRVCGVAHELEGDGQQGDAPGGAGAARAHGTQGSG